MKMMTKQRNQRTTRIRRAAIHVMKTPMPMLKKLLLLKVKVKVAKKETIRRIVNH
jgi:hypothetical protein